MKKYYEIIQQQKRNLCPGIFKSQQGSNFKQIIYKSFPVVRVKERIQTEQVHEIMNTKSNHINMIQDIKASIIKISDT